MVAMHAAFLECTLNAISVLARYTRAKQKALHLEKEVRFVLLDHLDLIHEHLSLTWHDLFWVQVLQQIT